MKFPIRYIFKTFYQLFLKSYRENYYHTKVINAISMCKTEALGGHSTVCDNCGDIQNHPIAFHPENWLYQS